MGSSSSKHIPGSYLGPEAYQALKGFSGPLSDIAGLSPILGAAGTAFPLIGAAAGLGSLIPSLISMFSGRSSTGPGSATADIAGLSGNKDPVLALLGEGAGKLGNNTPVSSPSAGPTFGPYFDVARKLGDLVRFGPGASAKDSNLTALTLKQAMTEAGNPGKAGGSTLQALQDAWNKGKGNLTADNLATLEKTMNPQELGILQGVLNGNAPSNTTVIPQTAATGLSSGQLAGSLAGLAPLLVAGGISEHPMEPIQLPQDRSKKKKKFQLPTGGQDVLQLLSQLQQQQ